MAERWNKVTVRHAKPRSHCGTGFESVSHATGTVTCIRGARTLEQAAKRARQIYGTGQEVRYGAQKEKKRRAGQRVFWWR